MLTWRLVLAAAVGSLVVLLLPVRPPAGLWVVNGALLVVAVADWVLGVRPRDLEVERDLPGIVPLGTEAQITWRIAHRRGRHRDRRGPGALGPGALDSRPGPAPGRPAAWRRRGVRVRM